MSAISTPEQVHLYEMHQGHSGWDDKKNSSVTVLNKEIDEDPRSISHGSINWQPGVRARFPWVGFAALLTILVSIIMTIVIMHTSDEKTQDQWPVYEKFTFIKAKWRAKAHFKPSVGLAICNTVSNLALAIAIGQGVSIAWWRKAMNGATVFELHKSWGFSASVLELLTAGRGFNLIALAALTAKLALLDSVLLQQAASDNPGIYTMNNTAVRVPILSKLPNNYTGVWSPDGTVGQFSQAFSESLYGYTTFGDLIQPTLPEAFEGRCDGLCWAQVEGFGFNISCTTDDHSSANYSVTPQTAINTTNAFANGDDLDPKKTLYSLLFVSASQNLSSQHNSSVKSSSISLYTQYAELKPAYGPAGNQDAVNCTGRVIAQTCNFQPAKVLYPVQIVNQTGETTANGYQISRPWWVGNGSTPEDAANSVADSYGILRNGQIAGVEVLETFSYDPAFDSNIQSFASMMEAMFGGSIFLEYLNQTGYMAVPSGSAAIGTWWTPLTSVVNPGDTINPETCVIPIENPSTYIMSQVNSIALRVSMELAMASVYKLNDTQLKSLSNQENTTLSFLKDATAVNDYPTIVYVSNWPWLWAAIASLLFCVLCVMPSYWGFWKLGRKVTLGPMEIASAFQAPVLNHPAVASGGEVEVLLKEVGSKRVRYGEVEGRLGVAEPGTVKKLWTEPGTGRKVWK